MTRLSRRPRRSALTLLFAAATALVLAWAAQAGADASGATTAPAAASQVKPLTAATLEQCITSATASERSATFTGEMSAIPGASRMEMRFDLLARAPRELSFHTVTAPGLGVWRIAAPGVKIYKYIKQVTDLSAPAAYRASVRFRWLAGRGHVLKSAELRTPKCEQPPPHEEGEGEGATQPPGSQPTGTVAGAN